MTYKKLYNLFLLSKGLSIDSRVINRGQIFLALKGKDFDGHDYIEQALAKGAKYVIIERKHTVSNKLHTEKIIRVTNTKKVLQNLARLHRLNFNIPVLVVGGSNGKTTTKDLIYRVLKQKYNVLYSPKSYNNIIGLSLTLLNLNVKNELAILEIGTNKIGEIKELLDICRPNYGVITSIGKEHLEGLKNINEVMKEEGEIFKYLKRTSGVAFVNKSLPKGILKYIGRKCIFFDPNQIQTISVFPIHFRIKNGNKNLNVYSCLVGKWNVSNIVIAITIGKYFSINIKDVIDAIGQVKTDNLRSQIIVRKTYQILLDCYNSNPSSMKEFLIMLKTIHNKGIHLVIGGMRELGKSSLKEHKILLNSIISLKPESATFIGEEFSKLVDKITKAGFNFSRSTENAREMFANIKLSTNSLIAVKGSRFYALEKIFMPYNE